MALTWSISGTTATAKDGSKTLVTIKGLKSGLTVSKDKASIVSGETSTAVASLITLPDETTGAITISSDLLGVTDVTLDKKSTYSLTVEDDVKATVDSASWQAVGTNTGIARLVAANVAAGYSTSDDGKTLSYSDAQKDKVLAVVGGLKSDISGFTSFPTVGSGVITLSKSMVGTTDVKVFKGNYTLDITSETGTDSIAAPTMKTGAGSTEWVINGTNAYLVGTMQAGFTYDTVNPGFADYHPEERVVLATLAGLEHGVKEEQLPTITAYPTIGTNADGKETIGYVDIKLGNAALGEGDVSLIGGKGFKLSIDSVSSSTDSVRAETVAAHQWIDNGATIKYATGTNDYYTVTGDNPTVIAYHAAELKDAFLLVGINDSVSVSSGYDNSISAGISLGSNNDSLKVTLDKQALAQMDVTLKSDDYTLAAVGSSDANSVPTVKEDGSAYWKVSGTSTKTASYNQNYTDGYTLTGAVLDYIESATKGIATIAGLAKDVTTSGNNGESIGTYAGANFTEGIDTKTEKTFTLNSNVLGTTGVTLTNASDSEYKLKLNDSTTSNVSVQSSKPNAKDTWAVSGTKAIYQNVTGAYYTLANDSLTVGYTPETVNATYAEISGLKSGLTVANDKIAGITASATTESGDEGNKVISQNFTLSRSVLNGDVKLTRGTGITTEYSLNLDTDAAPEENKTFIYSFVGTKASIVSGTTEGWTIKNALNISHVDASVGSTEATITGLNSATEKSDLTLKGTTVTLNERALPTKADTPASITNAEDSGSTYNLTFGDGIATSSTESKAWSVSGTKATFTETNSAYYSKDNNDKTITYHAPTVKSAVVKGLVSGLTVGTDNDTLKLFNGNNEAVSVNSSEIHLMEPALNKSAVTLENGTGANYSLKLAGGTSSLTVGADKGSVIWSVTKGTASGSVIGTVASYKATDTLVTYAAEKYDTTKAISITGLPTSTKAVAGNLDGIDVTIPTANGTGTIGTIEITDSSLLPTNAKSSVALGSTTKNYKLTLGEGITAPDFAHATWDFSGLTGGAASYKADVTSGHSVSDDGSKISYTEAKSNVEIARITGLKKTINAVEATEGITVDSAKKEIVLKKDILDATSTKLTTTYGYKFNDSVAAVASGPVSSWTFSGDKAEYNSVTLGSYKVDSLGTTLNYTVGSSTNLAKISGLEKSNLRYAADGVIEGIVTTSDKKVILANEKILGTKAVELTFPTVASGSYSLDTVTTGQVIDSPDPFATYFELKGGKASIKENRQAGYTISSNKLTYAKAVTGTVVAALTGINKNLTATEAFEGIQGKGISVATATASETKDTITFDSRALTSSEVGFNKGVGTDRYKLAVATVGDYSVSTVKGDPENFWDVSGGKAVLKRGVKAYYTPSDTVIAYNAAASVTSILTVSGLKKDATAADMLVVPDTLNTAVALTKQVLDTSKANAKVALKIDKKAPSGYAGKTTLRFYGDENTDTGHNDATVAGVEYADAAWTVDKKGNALYQATVNTEGYDIAADGQSAVYTVKENKGKNTVKTFMTLKGLSSTAEPDVDETKKVVTLAATDLAEKKVTLGKTDPYMIALDSDVPKAEPQGEITIGKKMTANKLTVTASGGYTEDYTLADTKTVNYTKAKAGGSKGVVVASVTGLTKDFEVTEEDQSAISTSTATRRDNYGSYTKISFTEEQLAFDSKDRKKTKITAGGIGHGFEFESSEIQIAGTKDNDILISNGGKVTITPGKGNDYVDLGDSGNNLYVYGKGDGNDYIVGFSANDTINLTGVKDINAATDVSVKKSGGNAVVWVGTSSITLTGMGDSSINIVSKNGSLKAYTPETESADLLADDNFITANNSALSDLIKPASDSYTPYDFGSALQFTKEGKSVPQLTYTGNKK